VLAVVLATAALATGGAPEQAAAEPDTAAAPESPSTSESPTRKPKPTKQADPRIRVREADYLGRDHKDVKKELESLGFRVEEQKVQATSPDQAKNTVGAVRPHGLVDPGSTLTILVWEEYKAPEDDWDPGDWDDDDEKPGKGDGKGHDD
jgi:hypothetical protein